MNKTLKTYFASALMLLCAALLFATNAFAADTASVSGQVYYGTNHVQFAVTGGGTVFFDLKKGDAYVARHMLCDFSNGGVNEVGKALDDAEIAADPAAALNYTLTVYTGRTPEGSTLATGAVAGIYADLCDESGAVTESVLTALLPYGGTPDYSGYEAPTTFYYNGVDYNYDGGADGHYRYVPYTPAALSGTITYVDEGGQTLSTDNTSLAGITAANPVTAAIPATMVVNGKTYTPSVRSVTAVYDGQINFTILCRTERNPGEGSFRATIKMVDESGKILMADGVNVNKAYTYAAPETFVQTAAGVTTVYTVKLAAGQTVQDATVFTMRPGDTVQEYTVTYTAQTENTAIGWNIIKVNGVTGAQLGTEIIQVQPGATANYTAAAQTVDGVNYTPVGGPDYSYTYGGSNLVQYIYYAPEGYTPEASYTITLQYKNIANNATLRSETINVAPGADTNLTIDANFSADGHDYVRLDGQADSLRHSYYSPKRIYTVFCRDVNDTLYANTVITETQTVTTTRTEETIRYDGGTTVVGGGAAGGAGGADGTRVTGPAAGDTLTAANNDATGQNDLFAENGEDTATNREIIEENQTPLAEGPASGETAPTEGAPAAKTISPVMTVALIAAALLMIALIVLIVVQRKKRNHNEH